MQMRVFSQGEVLYEIASNQTTAPPGAIRSCAISSLTLQAKLVINGWGECGYLLEEGDKLKLTNGTGVMKTSVISGPPNNTLCTPNMMGTKDCAIKFTRTVFRNTRQTLRDCIGKVKGVSQTCDAYKSCGPRMNIDPANLDDLAPKKQQDQDQKPNTDKKDPLPGVCNTPDVGYFREEEVQRMCGICDMFESIMPKGFQSPSAKFAVSLRADDVQAPPPRRRRGTGSGSSDLWLYLILIPLFLIFAAAIFFLCVQSSSNTKETTANQRLV
mmetsp:Transcript_76464/g.205924  ORF Transcript_76464/g.205924 Transcript_76464/m.205924 type:complete len:270 (+) Transcript_76464:353-1162(+)